MKQILFTTIAAVVLVGCGPRMHKAAEEGNIEVVKQHLAAGVYYISARRTPNFCQHCR